MRKYLFGTGLFSAILSGITLLRALREDAPFTWRQAVAWVSWGLTLVLAIGAVVDTRKATRGHFVDADSPIADKQEKLYRQHLRRG